MKHEAQAMNRGNGTYWMAEVFSVYLALMLWGCFSSLVRAIYIVYRVAMGVLTF